MRVLLSSGCSHPSVSIFYSCNVCQAEVRIDSISYCVMMNAIVRAGHIPFALSTRNTGTSLAHLLSITNTAFIYTSSDLAVQKVVTATTTKLAETNGVKAAQFPMPRLEDFQVNLDTATLLPPLVPPPMSSLAIILHSSGNTPLSSNERSFNLSGASS